MLTTKLFCAQSYNQWCGCGQVVSQLPQGELTMVQLTELEPLDPIVDFAAADDEVPCCLVPVTSADRPEPKPCSGSLPAVPQTSATPRGSGVFPKSPSPPPTM